MSIFCLLYCLLAMPSAGGNLDSAFALAGSNAGQLKLYGKGIIDRQGVAGHNKCAGNAYVAYAGAGDDASMAGHDFQGGFYAFCLTSIFHGRTRISVIVLCTLKEYAFVCQLVYEILDSVYFKRAKNFYYLIYILKIILCVNE